MLCVLIVEGMSVVVNVMLSTFCLVQPIGTHGGEVMYFGCVCFRGELGFLNCECPSAVLLQSIVMSYVDCGDDWYVVCLCLMLYGLSC